MNYGRGGGRCGSLAWATGAVDGQHVSCLPTRAAHGFPQSKWSKLSGEENFAESLDRGSRMGSPPDIRSMEETRPALAWALHAPLDGSTRESTQTRFVTAADERGYILGEPQAPRSVRD